MIKPPPGSSRRCWLGARWAVLAPFKMEAEKWSTLALTLCCTAAELGPGAVRGAESSGRAGVQQLCRLALRSMFVCRVGVDLVSCCPKDTCSCVPSTRAFGGLALHAAAVACRHARQRQFCSRTKGIRAWHPAFPPATGLQTYRLIDLQTYRSHCCVFQFATIMWSVLPKYGTASFRFMLLICSGLQQCGRCGGHAAGHPGRQHPRCGGPLPGVLK